MTLLAKVHRLVYLTLEPMLKTLRLYMCRTKTICQEHRRNFQSTWLLIMQHLKCFNCFRNRIRTTSHNAINVEADSILQMIQAISKLKWHYGKRPHCQMLYCVHMSILGRQQSLIMHNACLLFYVNYIASYFKELQLIMCCTVASYM